MKTYFIFILLSIVFLTGCKPNQSEIIRHLRFIDSLAIYGQTDSALVLMQNIERKTLNDELLRYMDLIRLVCESDHFSNIDSDTAISALVDYYKKQPVTEEYVRSLLYLGIARKNLQLCDTLVYEPLKLAKNLMTTNPQLTGFKTQIQILYYLGRIHEQYGNHNIAENYYLQSKELARQNNDSDLIILNGLAIVWNHLRYRRYEQANKILANLESIKNLTELRLFNIKNARAAYFHRQNLYDSALIAYREIARLADNISGRIQYPNIYYSLSVNFQALSQPDSALYYAHKSVNSISDTLFTRKNYFLYQHIADLAYQQEDYKLAAEMHKHAFDWLHKATDQISEKRLLQLEKQYNYSQLEMAALKQRQQLHKVILSISLIAILLGLFIFIFRYKLRQKGSSLEKETLMRQIAESWAIHISKEKAQKEQLLTLYHQLTQRHAATQEHLEQLSYRFIKENPSIHDAVQTELQALKNEFNEILNEIIHEDLFYSYFNISKEIPLTTGEKIILFLLHCDLNSKQLSTMMGINQGSLRVRKSNLRRKLSEFKNQYPDIENVLALL